MTNPPTQSSLALWAGFFATALLALSFGFTEMAGSDMWWHVAAGREILQQQTLWLVDTWSYSAAGEPWRNHEWLSDLIYHGWVQAFGLESLVYWKWSVIVVTFACLFFALLHYSGSAAAAALATAAAVALAAPFLDIRPHLWTLLGFALVLLALSYPRPKLWLLALLLLVWVNLHGGFVFGLMVVGIALFPWRVLAWPGALARGGAVYWLGALALLCAVCLLNPDGWQVLLLPLTYAFDSSSPYRQLGEWLSPLRAGGIQAPLFFGSLASVPLAALCQFYFWRRDAQNNSGHLPWGSWALLLLTLAMAFTSRRFIPLYGFALALVWAPLLARTFAAWGGRWLQPGALLALALWGGYRLLPYSLAAAPNFHYLTAAYQLPVDTVNFALHNGLSGRVFALYNWGGYLHYRSDGQLQVFIDGRANTVYSDEHYLDYTAALFGSGDPLAIIEGSGAEWVLWPNRRARGEQMRAALLGSGSWQLLYEDTVSSLYAREEPAEVLQAPPLSPQRNLTLAQQAASEDDWLASVQFARRAANAAPYHLGACHQLAQSYRVLNEPALAAKEMQRCRDIFPSAYLR